MLKNKDKILLSFFIVLILMLILTYMIRPKGENAQTITVFAAASVFEPINKIISEFTKKYGIKVKLNSASSSTLARQIAHGAHVDFFISAHEQWITYLQDKNIVDSTSQIAHNRLILATHEKSLLKISSDLAQTLRLIVGKISIADPTHVPAGIYTQEALRSIKMWEQLKSHFVYAPDAQRTVALLARAEVDAAIIYQSDLFLSSQIKKICAFSKDLHMPINYYAARLKKSNDSTFLAYLLSEDAQKIFENSGFSSSILSLK